MKFKELREKICLEREEIIINKKVTIHGKEILLLSLIKDKDSNKLWTIYKNEYKSNDSNELLPKLDSTEEIEESEYKEEYEEITLTNREERVNSIKQ
ncbi:MAG: hypothetical protein ACRC3Y_16225, partial [Romboutsia sp.]|uniref:hypothetical protein n=1 Tax=Romboutsia sp. TaxID=1965302 RepID=UPI003F34F06A